MQLTEKRGHFRVVVYALASRLEILFITSFGEESHVVVVIVVINRNSGFNRAGGAPSSTFD